jgi:hypothetical protein
MSSRGLGRRSNNADLVAGGGDLNVGDINSDVRSGESGNP